MGFVFSHVCVLVNVPGGCLVLYKVYKHSLHLFFIILHLKLLVLKEKSKRFLKHFKCKWDHELEKMR